MKDIVRVKKEDALIKLESFLDDKNTVLMATVSESGEPFISYAPYVEDEEHNYYVYLSGHAPHAINLAKTKKASIMFIEDESKCQNLFARERLYFQANASMFEQNDENEAKINELFSKKFGKLTHFLQKMPDFRIYKLSAYDGNLVLGFGSAFEVSENRCDLTLKNVGHQKHHEHKM